MSFGKRNIASGVRSLNCADLKFQPRRSCPGDSASFRALNPMVTTRQVGGRAGGASRGGPGGRATPG
eukprot:15442923-Alexandrium_andersonii.AAC.1